MVRLPEDFYREMKSLAFKESDSLQKWLLMVLKKYLEEKK
jgi:hypothetical protein